jgi:hypothetical protein
MLDDCSRHRAKHTPNSTPDGFWALSVPTPPDWKRQDAEAAARKDRAARRQQQDDEGEGEGEGEEEEEQEQRPQPRGRGSSDDDPLHDSEDLLL